jgi:hypothetical protein
MHKSTASVWVSDRANTALRDEIGGNHAVPQKVSQPTTVFPVGLLLQQRQIMQRMEDTSSR